MDTVSTGYGEPNRGELYTEDFIKYKTSFQDYLTEHTWYSQNGKLMEYSEPVLGIRLTAEHFYETIKTLFKEHTNIFRISICLSFILKSQEKLEYFYASSNSSIIQPEYMFINKNSIGASFSNIWRKLQEAEAQKFMTDITNRYAENSRATIAIPCNVVYKCVLSKMKMY